MMRLKSSSGCSVWRSSSSASFSSVTREFVLVAVEGDDIAAVVAGACVSAWDRDQNVAFDRRRGDRSTVGEVELDLADAGADRAGEESALEEIVEAELQRRP